MKSVLLTGAAALALAACTTTRDDNSSASAGAVAEAALAAVDAEPVVEAAPAAPNNILLADWTGPHAGVPPFDRVTPEMFPEALQFAIDELKREVRAISVVRSAPTFENTIVPLERSGQRLDRVLAVFGVMTSNMATPAYQALDSEWSPRIAAA